MMEKRPAACSSCLCALLARLIARALQAQRTSLYVCWNVAASIVRVMSVCPRYTLFSCFHCHCGSVDTSAAPSVPMRTSDTTQSPAWNVCLRRRKRANARQSQPRLGVWLARVESRGIRIPGSRDRGVPGSGRARSRPRLLPEHGAPVVRDAVRPEDISEDVLGQLLRHDAVVGHRQAPHLGRSRGGTAASPSEYSRQITPRRPARPL